jgi:hypothetical protein
MKRGRFCRCLGAIRGKSIATVFEGALGQRVGDRSISLTYSSWSKGDLGESITTVFEPVPGALVDLNAVEVLTLLTDGLQVLVNSDCF